MADFNKVLVALAMITVIAVGGVWMYVTLVKPPIPPVVAAIEGTLTFNAISEKDSFDQSANAGTNPSYTAWHMKMPGVFPIASKDDLGTSVTLSTSAASSVGIASFDNRLQAGGYRAYLVIHLYAGTADYLDIPGTMAKHTFFVGAAQTNLDITGDGFPDTLVMMELTGLGINKNSATYVSVSPLLMTSDTTLTDNDPADIASIGTSGTYKTITWQWTYSSDAEKKASAIARIYVSSNRTDDYVQFKELTITSFDGSQKYIATAVSTSVTTTSYTAYFLPALGVDYRYTVNGFMCKRDIGTNTYISTALRTYCTFPSSGVGYAIIATIYVVFIGPNNALASANSDPVTMQAAA